MYYICAVRGDKVHLLVYQEGDSKMSKIFDTLRATVGKIVAFIMSIIAYFPEYHD